MEFSYIYISDFKSTFLLDKMKQHNYIPIEKLQLFILQTSKTIRFERELIFLTAGKT